MSYFFLFSLQGWDSLFFCRRKKNLLALNLSPKDVKFILKESSGYRFWKWVSRLTFFLSSDDEIFIGQTNCDCWTQRSQGRWLRKSLPRYQPKMKHCYYKINFYPAWVYLSITIIVKKVLKMLAITICAPDIPQPPTVIPWQYYFLSAIRSHLSFIASWPVIGRTVVSFWASMRWSQQQNRSRG